MDRRGLQPGRSNELHEASGSAYSADAKHQPKDGADDGGAATQQQKVDQIRASGCDKERKRGHQNCHHHKDSGNGRARFKHAKTPEKDGALPIGKAPMGGKKRCAGKPATVDASETRKVASILKEA